MRRTLPLLLVAATIASGAMAQVTASHVEPPAAPTPTEVQSPMELTIPLGPSGTGPAVLDLEVNRSRRFTETAQFVVDRMQIKEVRVGKRLGRKKQDELLITVSLTTGWFRQKVDVSLALVGAAGQAWSWKDRVVLGMKAGDIIAGGGLGAATASKDSKVEISVPVTAELRQALAADPQLRIVIAIVD